MRFDLNELSKEERIGQMIMVGMDTNYITDRIKRLIQKYKIGGIILYRKNFGTYEDLINLINELKDLNRENKIPLTIAIDQEGGRVNRLPPEFHKLPSANLTERSGGYELVEEASSIIAEVLADAGFNMNFAPVLDLKNFKDKHAIGDRAYSNDINVVSKDGIAFMKQLQSKNIISVIKHFPGHGSTKEDSHFTLPIVQKSYDEIKNNDIVPFEIAIKNGADAMLVGHLVIPKITKSNPASLSKVFIGKYIRKRYKYNKLLITDDLKMKAIKIFYGEIRAVKKAFEAGNDIIVFRYKKNKEEKTIQSLLNLYDKNIGRVNRSVIRILKEKEKYNFNDNKIVSTIDIDNINKRIDKIRKKCNI